MRTFPILIVWGLISVHHYFLVSGTQGVCEPQDEETKDSCGVETLQKIHTDCFKKPGTFNNTEVPNPCWAISCSRAISHGIDGKPISYFGRAVKRRGISGAVGVSISNRGQKDEVRYGLLIGNKDLLNITAFQNGQRMRFQVTIKSINLPPPHFEFLLQADSEVNAKRLKWTTSVYKATSVLLEVFNFF